MTQPAKARRLVNAALGAAIPNGERLLRRLRRHSPGAAPLYLRKILASAGVFLILLIPAGATWIILDRHQAAYDAGERQAASLTVALGEQTARTLQGAFLDLADVVETIEAQHIASQDELAKTMGTQAMHDRLRAGISGLSQIGVIAVIRADGRLINSSEYWPTPDINLSDRSFFQALQDNPLLDRFISAPFISHANGSWTIYVVRRITAPNGTFIGIVAGAIDVAYFEDFYRAVAEGNGIDVSLWRYDGTLLASYPSRSREFDTTLYDPKASGSNAAAAQAAEAFAKNRSALEHRPMAVMAVKNLPLFVSVGRTAASIERDWRGQAIAVGIGALLSASLLALALVALLRQIARREASEIMLRQHRDNLEREVSERTRALAASETRHRDIVDVAVDWFWEMDAAHRFTFVSPRFGEAAGVPPENFIGKTIAEVTSIDVAHHDFAEFRAALATQRAFNNILQRIDLADGRKRFWRLSGKPFFDPESGAFAGYRGSGTDVTNAVENEIKLVEALSRGEAAEEQARRDRARLLDAIDVIPAGFALWDAQDRFELCNMRFRKMSEQASDLLVPGARYEDFARAIATRGGPDPGAEGIDGWVARRLARHRAPGETFVQRRTDGSWTQISERRTADGGIVGTYSDVTELISARRRAEAAEEQARRARARLVDAIELMPAGFALWDTEDRLEMCNARFREVYDKAADLIAPGLRFEDLLRAGVARGQYFLDDVTDLDSWMARALGRHQAPGGHFVELRLADGRWIQVDERPTADGGIVGTRTDVTELHKREATEHAREKLAALGHLAGGVAHEINNLLQPALIFPELVADHLPPDDVESREDLATIADCARKAREIVKNILRFARKEEVALEPLDLVAEVRAALAFVRDLIPPTVAIQESVDDAPEQRMVSANKTQLAQVITNLVVNAVHAMKDRGTITVAIKDQRPTPAEVTALGLDWGRSYTAISLTDTGCGMDAETQARIFEPFFTTKPIGEGTGLGLSVAYGILRSWDGAITVTSAPGQGTTLTLYIPNIPTSGAESQSAAA